MSRCKDIYIDLMYNIEYPLFMNNDKNTTKKLISIRLDLALVKDIQHLAIDLGRTSTSLFEEAARDLLVKFSKKEKAGN